MMAAPLSLANAPPLVVHLVYRLDIGGLETLLVDCINRMPPQRYRHAVVCLTGYTAFARRISRPDVALYALDKPAGLGLSSHLRLYRLLRALRPAILHTYNIGTLEYAAVAALAGVPVRVHAEHGRDAADPHGRKRRHLLLRRLVAPLVDCQVAVSADLAHWLRHTVGVPAARVRLIGNGVDTARFAPGQASAPWSAADAFVIGSVGRLQDVKDHASLIAAFARLRALLPDAAPRLRLAIVGDGPLRAALAAQVQAAGLGDCVWLAGAREDVPAVMRSFSLFALPSLAEGTPVTVLEAMASGLPVVASAVGGLPELVVPGVHGALVPPADPQRLADALAAYVRDPQACLAHGQAGRARVERQHSLSAMVDAYADLYDELRKSSTMTREAIRPCAE